jgi:hypothetical protein
MGFLFNKPADVPGSALPSILVGMFVAFGGILFGYDVSASPRKASESAILTR